MGARAPAFLSPPSDPDARAGGEVCNQPLISPNQPRVRNLLGLWLPLLPRDDSYDNVTAPPAALGASEEAGPRFASPRKPSRPRSHLGLPAGGSWAVGCRDPLPRVVSGRSYRDATGRELPIRRAARRKSRLRLGDATSAPRSAPRWEAGAGEGSAPRVECGRG